MPGPLPCLLRLQGSITHFSQPLATTSTQTSFAASALTRASKIWWLSDDPLPHEISDELKVLINKARKIPLRFAVGCELAAQHRRQSKVQQHVRTHINAEITNEFQYDLSSTEVAALYHGNDDESPPELEFLHWTEYGVHSLQPGWWDILAFPLLFVGTGHLKNSEFPRLKPTDSVTRTSQPQTTQNSS
jgi:hypothetical protein